MTELQTDQGTGLGWKGRRKSRKTKTKISYESMSFIILYVLTKHHSQVLYKEQKRVSLTVSELSRAQDQCQVLKTVSQVTSSHAEV